MHRNLSGRALSWSVKGRSRGEALGWGKPFQVGYSLGGGAGVGEPQGLGWPRREGQGL